MLALMIFAATFGLIAIGAIWNGYALTILWGWFVVPTFGAPMLALAPAIGLAMVASYLTHQYTPKVAREGSTWEQIGHALSHTAMKPAIALLVGWVVKQWM